MKKPLFMYLFMMCAIYINAQEVTISGNKFYVGNQEIFFNGINSPWQPQGDWSLDFLGRNFDENWWNWEFQRFVDNHMNLARIWIHGAGNYSPSLNGDGLVTGASSQFWSDMDKLVQISREKKVYIMPTLWSFDMVKNTSGWSWYYDQYRQIVNDANKTQWYIEYFLIPFLQRYENEPYVMGYDICNEPEHMWRDSNCGYLNRDNVVRFVAMVAAAINQYSSKPVTVGSMWIILNSNKYSGQTWEGYMGNNWSNSSMQAQYNNSNAYLDFWSPHWYAWQNNGGPFETSIGFWLDDGSRPALIGETYGDDVYSGHPSDNTGWNISMANYYLQSYWNGYAGVCGWKNPKEDDGQGSFYGVSKGTNAFYNNYPELVYPQVNIPTNDPQYIQAEDYNNMSGIAVETCSEGGSNVGWIDAGDWLVYDNINIPTSGVYTIDYRVASANGGGNLQLERAGSGEIYGSTSIPSTGGWQNWAYVGHTVNLDGGVQSFGIKALSGGWNINWWAITPGTKSAKVESSIKTAELIATYPNPVTDKLTVKAISDELNHLTVVDMQGRQILTKSFKGKQEINVKEAGMNSGVYMLRMKVGETWHFTKVIVK